MRKLTLIIVLFVGLTLSSCKEEEKEHLVFLKFLLEAENPEEFLKSSSYFDSTFLDNKIEYEVIKWYSKIAIEEGFGVMRIKNKGIKSTKFSCDERIVHEIHLGSKYSDFPHTRILFRQNDECKWKLYRFARIPS
jgi:hypothetical protein